MKVYLRKLVLEFDKYFYNDLYLWDVFLDELINVYFYFIVMILNNSEVIFIMDGKLVLGIW